MSNEINEKNKISEEELAQAAGGWSENRYDPAECGKHNKYHNRCGENFPWCEHYRHTLIGYGVVNRKCVMGYFDYDDEVRMGGR